MEDVWEPELPVIKSIVHHSLVFLVDEHVEVLNSIRAVSTYPGFCADLQVMRGELVSWSGPDQNFYSFLLHLK